MPITPIIPAAIASPLPPPTSTTRHCRQSTSETSSRAGHAPGRVAHILESLFEMATLYVAIAALNVSDHLASIAARVTRYLGRRRIRVGRGRGGHVDGERGQATTEYALILLAAALVGLMVVAWATAGGGAARISRLFNGVIDAVIDKV